MIQFNIVVKVLANELLQPQEVADWSHFEPDFADAEPNVPVPQGKAMEKQEQYEPDEFDKNYLQHTFPQ